MKTLDVSIVPAILTIINRSGKDVEIPLYPDNGSISLAVGRQIIYKVTESREYLYYYNVCASLGLDLEVIDPVEESGVTLDYSEGYLSLLDSEGNEVSKVYLGSSSSGVSKDYVDDQDSITRKSIEDKSIQKEHLAQWISSGPPTPLVVDSQGLGTKPDLALIVKNYDRDKLGNVIFLERITIHNDEIDAEYDLRFNSLNELNNYLTSVGEGIHTFSFYKKSCRGVKPSIIPYNQMYSMVIGRKHLGDTRTSLHYLIEEWGKDYPSSRALIRLMTDLYSVYGYTIPDNSSLILDASKTITKTRSKKKMYNLRPNFIQGTPYMGDSNPHYDRKWFDLVDETFVNWEENLNISYGDSWYWTSPLNKDYSRLIDPNDLTMYDFIAEPSFIKVQELRTIINGHQCRHFRMSPVGIDTLVINGFINPLLSTYDFQEIYSMYMIYQDETSGKKICLIKDGIPPTYPGQKFYRVMPDEWKRHLPNHDLNRVSKKSLKFLLVNKLTGVSFEVASIILNYHTRGAILKPMMKISN